MDDLAPWLAGEVGDPTEPLVVLGGDKPGIALAGLARQRGPGPVTVLEESQVFAASNGVVGRWRYVHDAREAGVALEGGARVVAIEPAQVRWLDASGVARTTPARRVLVTSGATPDDALVRALRERGIPAQPLGDCRALGRVEGAMKDATEAVLAL